VSRKKIGLIAVASTGALVVAAIVAALIIVQSGWFREKVRASLISTIENATGGRAEIGSFQFDWRQMRVEVSGLVLHGDEPAAKPPLIRARTVTVGLKIISVVEQKVDVQYLDVRKPEIYVMVYPDGHTNIPEPKIKRRSEQTAVDTLINLAIGRFNVQDGSVEIEGRNRIPFSARGNNLDAKFVYDLAGPRYDGNVSMQPLEVQWDGKSETPLAITAALRIEKNRIGITSARVATGESQVEFSGEIADLAAPHASFRYDARVTAADVNRVFPIRGLERGTAQLAGNAEWRGASMYSVTGNLGIADGEFRQTGWQLRSVKAAGALQADANGARLGGLRFSGESVENGARFPINGQAAEVTLQGEDLTARSLAVNALGGGFAGEVRLRGGKRFEVRGELHNLEVKRAVTLYSREPLPWNSLVSGPVQMEGSLPEAKDLRASGDLSIAPAPESAPVRGQVAVRFDRAKGTLELSRSTILLPASRVELSGAIGRQLRVHVDTRDIADFLAALGESAVSIPVKLENGTLVFDGTVTGQLDTARVAGHLALTHFAYAGRSFDSLQADVNASPAEVRLQKATLARGGASAQFQISTGLQNWKPVEASALSGDATVRNAAVADLLGLVNQKTVPVTGMLAASGRIGGTIGNPEWSADIQVVKGSLWDEPFDRFAARVTGNSRTAQLVSGQVVGGVKQIEFAATFDHEPAHFDTGRLRFQVRSNVQPLADIESFARSRPGLQGTIQFAGTGAIELAPARNGDESFRFTELQGDITARGLQLAKQRLGDAHLTANSQGAVLRAHLDSSFANSAVTGDGEWRMEGDYPGTANLTFSRLDLAGLREWVSPSAGGAPYPFSGFAEGELHITGPALKPDLLRADVRIPNLEIRPVAAANGIVLRNSGPIVASAANSTITIEKAELTGRSTDVTVGGKISLTQKSPLDLRVNGRVDLAVLQTFNPDVTTTGQLTVEATVRGSPAAPQVSGRIDLKDGAASYGMLPNGITHANGVILFTGDRATIQNLEGTTGGGKIQISGFTGYAGNDVLFGLHLNAQQVRVRYPEGVSTVADTSLDFTGSPTRSLLAGTITVQRASLNLQSDFSSLLAKSAQPVQTPSVASGFLANVNYDVQIQTAPDIVFESSLTQDVEANANLRLRGTATNPALLGRINITQGQLVFFGTKYTISQGSVSFFNPVRVDPVLNVDLDTKARGIDITLSVAGPLNKLTVTPRSDPPLQFGEIVSVLTTGDAPVSDFTRLNQEAAPSQSLQQSNMTALLGQVIANPVSGRLQRFFGVSKLRINPTLDPALANGVQYNPQARLTIEQQVTPDVTFTYVTNLTNANPQVVSVEWAVNKQWSVVAQREENGLVGLDFYLKKQFK